MSLHQRIGNIEDGLTQIRIFNYNEARVSERMGSSDVEDAASTYYPGYAQLFFHMMDRSGKL